MFKKTIKKLEPSDLAKIKIIFNTYRLLTEKGIIDINLYFSEVQLSNESMRNSFDVTKLAITNSGLKSYPYRVTTTIDGIKYFTICDEWELERYFPELIQRSDKNVKKTPNNALFKKI